MKRTYLVKRLSPRARPIQILHEWEIIDTVQADNLPDALKRFHGEHRDEFTHALVTGNTLTVRSVETGFDVHLHARDVPEADFLGVHSVGV